MNAMVLILLMVCGNPVAMTGWGMDLNIGPFFGTMEFIEKDEGVNIAVQQLLADPRTEKVKFEMVAQKDQKFKCGTQS